MDEEQPPSVKEVIEGMNAFNDMMKLFKASQGKLGTLMPLFMAAVEGDTLKWFEGIEKVSDLDIDDAHGCLIVALSGLSQIAVKIRGTEADDLIKDLLKPKGN